jgi:hypothetical protein
VAIFGFSKQLIAHNGATFKRKKTTSRRALDRATIRTLLQRNREHGWLQLPSKRSSRGEGARCSLHFKQPAALDYL